MPFAETLAAFCVELTLSVQHAPFTAQALPVSLAVTGLTLCCVRFWSLHGLFDRDSTVLGIFRHCFLI